MSATDRDEGPEGRFADLVDRSAQRSEQARRLRKTAGPPLAAALALLLLCAFLVVATTRRATPAGPTPSHASLPSVLFDAPAWLDGVSRHPIGVPAGLLYDGLPVRDSAGPETTGLPVAVGATRDVVRAVRAAAPAGPVTWAPSSDGRYVAVARGAEEAAAGPIAVTVVDLVTGTDQTFRYRHRDRGSVDGLRWIPGSHALAVEVTVADEVRADGTFSGRVSITRLDASTRRWMPWGSTSSLPMAFSPDGRRLVRLSDDGAPEIAVAPDTAPRPIKLDLSGGHEVTSAAFSPDGSLVALLVRGLGAGENADTAYDDSVKRPHDVVLVDSRTGVERTRQTMGPVLSAALLGWGHRGLLVKTEAQRVGRATIERVTPGDSSATTVMVRPAPGVFVDQVAVPAAFVDAPARQEQRPNYSTIDPAAVQRWAKRGGVLLLLVLALGGMAAAYRRRRSSPAPHREPGDR